MTKREFTLLANVSMPAIIKKIGGELASASSLSKEFYYYRVSLFPLGECQPGCHYKSWLFQARNHVRWRELVYFVGVVSSGASRLFKKAGCWEAAWAEMPM